MEQLAFKNAPNLHSGRLGVIGDFKTWLENIPVTKSYKFTYNYICRLRLEQSAWKSAPDLRFGPVGLVEGFFLLYVHK